MIDLIIINESWKILLLALGVVIIGSIFILYGLVAIYASQYPRRAVGCDCTVFYCDRKDPEKLLRIPNEIAFAHSLSDIYSTTGSGNVRTEKRENNENLKSNSMSTSSFPFYLSIVVPCYNEEERLPIMLNETLDYIYSKLPNEKVEIILVDDGSKDRTGEVVHEYMKLNSNDDQQSTFLPKKKVTSRKTTHDTTQNETKKMASLRNANHTSSNKNTKSDKTQFITMKPRPNPNLIIAYLKLHKNRGKGGAVREGMLLAQGRYRLMVDADGATTFEELTRLLESIQKIESCSNIDQQKNHSAAKDHQLARSQPAIVVGSRSKNKDTVSRTLLRLFLQKGFHFLVALAIGTPIEDTQCGFKLFNSEACKLIFPAQHIERWAFDLELLYLAASQGISVMEIGVEWQEIAGSKVDIFSASFTMARDLFMMRAAYACGFWRPCDEVPDTGTVKKNV